MREICRPSSVVALLVLLLVGCSGESTSAIDVAQSSSSSVAEETTSTLAPTTTSTLVPTTTSTTTTSIAALPERVVVENVVREDDAPLEPTVTGAIDFEFTPGELIEFDGRFWALSNNGLRVSGDGAEWVSIAVPAAEGLSLERLDSAGSHMILVVAPNTQSEELSVLRSDDGLAWEAVEPGIEIQRRNTPPVRTAYENQVVGQLAFAKITGLGRDAFLSRGGPWVEIALEPSAMHLVGATRNTLFFTYQPVGAEEVRVARFDVPRTPFWELSDFERTIEGYESFDPRLAQFFFTELGIRDSAEELADSVCVEIAAASDRDDMVARLDALEPVLLFPTTEHYQTFVVMVAEQRCMGAFGNLFGAGDPIGELVAAYPKNDVEPNVVAACANATLAEAGLSSASYNEFSILAVAVLGCDPERGFDMISFDHVLDWFELTSIEPEAQECVIEAIVEQALSVSLTEGAQRLGNPWSWDGEVAIASKCQITTDEVAYLLRS